MNWRNGLFRVWLLISALWIGAVSFHAFKHFSQRSCVEDMLERMVGDFRDCDAGLPYFGYPDLILAQRLDFVIVGLAPIFILLLLGAAGYWIARGFKVPPKKA